MILITICYESPFKIEFHKKPATVARYARYRLSSFVSFRAEAACVLVYENIVYTFV